MSDKYIPGDHYILCDATGFKIRRSEAVKQWDGAWVHKDYCDVMHPMDGPPPEPSKPRPTFPTRPEAEDNFIDVEDAPFTD